MLREINSVLIPCNIRLQTCRKGGYNSIFLSRWPPIGFLQPHEISRLATIVWHAVCYLFLLSEVLGGAAPSN